MRAWPTSDAYLFPLPSPPGQILCIRDRQITHLSLPTPRWPSLGPHGPTCSGPSGLDWWQKKFNNSRPVSWPEDSLSGSEMENTQWWCLLWGSHTKPKPHTGFSSVGTEKNVLKMQHREKKMEKYRQKQRSWERQKEKESLEQRGPQSCPKFQTLSFQPLP